MTSSNPLHQKRYTLTAIVLHWVLGVALLGMVAVGAYMADLPFSPTRLKLYNWHKWAGISILVLSAVRLGWRMTHRPPELPHSIEDAMPAWQRVAHHATHHGLYALFLWCLCSAGPTPRQKAFR